MKNWLIIGGVALLVFIILLWFLFGREAPSLIPSENTEPIGDVSVLSPALSLKRVVSEDYLAVEENEDVATGDQIRTGENGRGLVSLDEGSLTVIDYSTDFVVKREEGGTSMQLQSGNLWSRVQKLAGKGEFYEVETKNAVAVVRGTSFGFGFLNSISTLIVSEGIVGLIPKDPKTGERLLDKEQKILAGQKATVEKDGKITVKAISSADKNEWYIFNNPKESILPKTNTPINQNPGGTSGGTPTPIPTPTPNPTPATTPLTMTSIVPSKVTINEEAPPTISINGSGFLKVTSVVVGKNTIPSQDVFIRSDSQIRVVLGSIQNSGVYDVTVIDLSGRSVVLPRSLTLDPAIVVTPPPSEEPPPNTFNPNDYYPQ